LKQLISNAPLEIQDLFKKALQARAHSYSPYSECKVGAALITQKNQVFSGCNVENASYGGSICAERSAITAAISQTGKIQIKQLLVVTDATPPWPPCGMCRQVIAEFGSNPLVYLANVEGDYITFEFQELFPQAFNPEALNSGSIPQKVN
jgi:cytidine deaminase